MSEVGTIERLNLGNGIRVISFFTGAGGLDLGFDRAGYDVVYATDIDEMCCRTLEANLGGALSAATVVERADIRKIDPTTLPKDIDLIIGGPPCQSFSASGRRAGGAPGRLDERGTLFEAYCNVIDVVRPKAFLFENVRGILGTNKGEDWKIIVAAFQKIGYSVDFRILDALDYGAPQQRERMIMVGHTMTTSFLFPRPLRGPDSTEGIPHLSAGQALSGLVNDTEDKDSLILRNGKYAHLLPEVPHGENYLYFTAKRGHPNPVFAYRSRFSDFLYKANPDTPIKTLIASPGKYTGPFHWDSRCFTVREYLRLQGFPDDYKIIGDRADRVKQIGNSVSPKLAYQLAICIAKQIFNRPIEMELLPIGTMLSFDSRKGKKAALTRARHTTVALTQRDSKTNSFSFSDYESSVRPYKVGSSNKNVVVRVEDKTARISVKADGSRKLFARMRLEIFGSEELLRHASDPDAILEVTAYGESDHSIQTMWNAVDEWVIRSSNFHSLFELYGHFTEPHPVFKVTHFDPQSRSPIAAFAAHIANFENCSRYFPREHLTNLFGCSFGTSSFVDLVTTLRKFRFDIRCYETNIAIPKNVYMVSYPFTLPFGKQMNFTVRSFAPVEGEISDLKLKVA